MNYWIALTADTYARLQRLAMWPGGWQAPGVVHVTSRHVWIRVDRRTYRRLRRLCRVERVSVDQFLQRAAALYVRGGVA